MTLIAALHKNEILAVFAFAIFSVQPCKASCLTYLPGIWYYYNYVAITPLHVDL